MVSIATQQASYRLRRWGVREGSRCNSIDSRELLLLFPQLNQQGKKEVETCRRDEHTRTRTPHTHTRTYTRKHTRSKKDRQTRTRTHVYTHTHTQTQTQTPGFATLSSAHSAWPLYAVVLCSQSALSSQSPLACPPASTRPGSDSAAALPSPSTQTSLSLRRDWEVEVGRVRLRADVGSNTEAAGSVPWKRQTQLATCGGLAN